METGGKEEEDHLPEEMHLHQDTETPPKHNASTAEKKGHYACNCPQKRLQP